MASGILNITYQKISLTGDDNKPKLLDEVRAHLQISLLLKTIEHSLTLKIKENKCNFRIFYKVYKNKAVDRLEKNS